MALACVGSQSMTARKVVPIFVQPSDTFHWLNLQVQKQMLTCDERRIQGLIKFLDQQSYLMFCHVFTICRSKTNLASWGKK